MNGYKIVLLKAILCFIGCRKVNGYAPEYVGAFGGEGVFSDNAGGFGMMWNDKTNTIHSWDHYDYSAPQRWWANIPNRRKPLEIRSEVKLDPKKGSVILNELLKQQ